MSLLIAISAFAQTTRHASDIVFTHDRLPNIDDTTGVHCMRKSVFQKRFQQRKRTSNFISISETKGTTFSNLNNVKNGQTISRNKSISSLSIIGFLYCCEKLKLFPLLFQLRIINLFSPETVYNRYSVFYFENAL